MQFQSIAASAVNKKSRKHLPWIALALCTVAAVAVLALVAPSNNQTALSEVENEIANAAANMAINVASKKHGLLVKVKSITKAEIPAGLKDMKADLTVDAPNINFPNSPDKSPFIANKQIPSQTALEFSGSIIIPKTDDYTFYLRSDDGSILYIDGKVVVNNDGQHPSSERSSKVTLKKGKHQIRVSYFEWRGEFDLKLSWSSPSIPKQIVPSSSLIVRDSAAVEAKHFKRFLQNADAARAVAEAATKAAAAKDKAAEELSKKAVQL